MTGRLMLAVATTVIALAAPADVVAEAGAATTPTTIAEPGGSTATVLDNAFLPKEANIGDCVSSLPRPDCGSEARGGWPQTLILVALVAALGVIGWRIVAGMRRKPTP